MEMTYKERVVRKHWITLAAITAERRKLFPAAMISLGVAEGVMGSDKTPEILAIDMSMGKKISKIFPNKQDTKFSFLIGARPKD